MGKPGATQAEVEEAAKMANAHNFILEFPAGYNTEVCVCVRVRLGWRWGASG